MLVEQSTDRFEIDRLDEMMIKAGLTALLDRLIMAISGQRDEQEISTGMCVAKVPGNLITVENRQADIQQDNFRVK